MRDDDLRDLARRSGIALDWRDQRGEIRPVSIDTLRAILAAMDVSPDQPAGAPSVRDRPLVTTRVGRQVSLGSAGFSGDAVALEDERGAGVAVTLSADVSGTVMQAPATPGYYQVHQAGRTVTLAVAPARGPTIAERLGGRGWALAAQIYALRSRHDGGIGNFGGVAALGAAAGARGADAVAVSPTHAL
ncbi:MAG: hypothetical protein ACT6XS_18290, partial [Phreatobacter sp.]